MTTGMIRPTISLFWVRALNCLQNSMMLIWAWPSAGPTGGAGVALPASIWSFTCPCTFFGAIWSLPESFFHVWSVGALACAQHLRNLLDLSELQLHWSGSAKDRDHHLQGLAIFVHFVHRAVEVRKRTVGDAHSLVLLELDFDPRLVFADVHAVDDLVHFVLGQRRRIVRGSYKSRDTRS